MQEVKFLGHAVSQGGILVNPSKIEAVLNWERLTMATEVRSFLRVVRYYRRFINDFSQIALSLTQLTRKYVSFKWMVKCKKSFQELKQKFTTALVLVLLDPHGLFEVYCDASRKGLGCVLMQNRNIATYASRQ